MYPRIKTVRHADKTYDYLHIVESKRVDGKVRQKFLASLGRLGEDPQRGLEAAKALARFYEKQIAEGLDKEEKRPLLRVTETRSFGPLAILDELWKEIGLDRILSRLGQSRHFDFPLERAVFAMVAQRLLDPGSKLACAGWLQDEVYLPGAPELDEDDLYATLSWLEEVRSGVELGVYDALKESSRLDSAAVFYDTTTTWFEGRGPEELAQFGRGKPGQPKHRRQILVGLVRSEEGWPITHRVFPGKKTDVETVKEILLDLRQRFGIERCVFVGDRGMVSQAVLDLLEELGFEYVLAVKLRSLKEVREKVLPRAGAFSKVTDNLEVKEAGVEDRRYLVCRNPASVERDRKRRGDILSALEAKLAKGDRVDTQHGREILVNRAFRRYTRAENGRVKIDRAAVAEDAKTDGKWVLRSNADMKSAATLALLYKSLGRIERDFRDLKSFLELRPMYHRKEERVKAHVLVCVLAKVLMVELERRRQAGKLKASVPKLLKVLRSIKATRIEIGENVQWTRTEISARALEVIKGLGIKRKLPQTLARKSAM